MKILSRKNKCLEIIDNMVPFIQMIHNNIKTKWKNTGFLAVFIIVSVKTDIFYILNFQIIKLHVEVNMNFSVCPKIKKKTMSFGEYLSTSMEEMKMDLVTLSHPSFNWQISEGVSKKVSENGDYIDFKGDTIVWPADKKLIRTVRDIQQIFYADMKYYIAAPLIPDTFHITIHDLNNEFTVHNGLNERNIDEVLKKSAEDVEDVFSKLNEYLEKNPEYNKVKMDYIGVSSNQQVALGIRFTPSTEKDYNILMNVYNMFEHIVYLPYYLRPHITLGYFKPIQMPRERIDILVKKIKTANKTKLTVTMNMMDIVHQTFSNMNKYESQFAVSEC